MFRMEVLTYLIFSATDTEMGVNDSRLLLKKKSTVKVSAKVVANLPEAQTESGRAIAQLEFSDQPYWQIERARIGTTRKVPVELLVNGFPVDTTEITADGTWRNINFEYPVSRSSWLALRIFGSSHTNPIFVIVDGKPIAEKKSAQWCIQSVEQCWKMKNAAIRQSEQSAAKDAYDKARKVYEEILKQGN